MAGTKERPRWLLLLLLLLLLLASNRRQWQHCCRRRRAWALPWLAGWARRQSARAARHAIRPHAAAEH